MTNAAIALFMASGESSYLARAEGWVTTADRHYWDGDAGGYFLSADDTTDVITRTKTIADHATPAGNGAMLEALARLSHITGKAGYRDRADALIRLFSGDNPQYLIGVPGFLTSYELLDRSRQVVIVGDAADERTQDLHQAALAAGDPLTVITRLEPGDTLPEGHPAFGKQPVDGSPTAWVCIDQTCGLPATEPAALEAQLAAA